MFDGVYRVQNGAAEFHSARSPTAVQLQSLLSRIIQRIMKALTRHGTLIEEGMTCLAEMETDAALAPLQSAARTWIALGRRIGQKVLTLKTAPTQNLEQSDQEYCANAHGFSLHAWVRCAMNQRKEREHPCRYITRPAIANARLALNDAGQMMLALKTPYLGMALRISSCRRWNSCSDWQLRSEIILGSKKNKSNPSCTNDTVPPSSASVRSSGCSILTLGFAHIAGEP